MLVVDAALALAVRSWAARAAWTPMHTLALGAAALLTYAWHAFPESPVLPATPAADTIGNAVFVATAAAVIAVAVTRTRPHIRARTSPNGAVRSEFCLALQHQTGPHLASIRLERQT